MQVQLLYKNLPYYYRLCYTKNCLLYGKVHDVLICAAGTATICTKK